VRFLIPALVILLPIAALALERVPPLVLVPLTIATVVIGLRAHLGHLLPGAIVGAALVLAWSLRPREPLLIRRVALATLGVLGLALPVVTLETTRARLLDRAWDRFAVRFRNPPAAMIEDVREAAAGRTVAVFGISTLWPFYGRDFSGRPVYVPVGRPIEEVSGPFCFAGDRRAAADRELWLRNLESARAAFVVGGRAGQTFQLRPEHVWCAGDSARFEPILRDGKGEIYRVRGS
jgi:hypothetical protein